MTHAAESTHFYTRKGDPAYTVTAKAGHQRPTMVADARKLGLVPSVTEIIKCCNKPALTNWMIDQGILAALTLPKTEGEREEDWLKRVKHDSKETARKAAERGTAVHAALQNHFECGGVDSQFQEACLGARKALLEAFGELPWFVERSFAHPLGFGGKVDIQSPAGIVCDFKTKEFGPDTKLDTYAEHSMQLAAYRHGFKLLDARCAIVYVSVTHPGTVRLIELPPAELAKGWQMFQGLLAYWIAKSSYNPAWQEEEVAA